MFASRLIGDSVVAKEKLQAQIKWHLPLEAGREEGEKREARRRDVAMHTSIIPLWHWQVTSTRDHQDQSSPDRQHDEPSPLPL